ncbi:hypothetical protein TeGR_g9468 [Tetraparma gracilis]|uniref:Uncharacterized protein n=1 Tax=Tetraparma gracilis TaxID=2962635 RepID=A0ABQ6N597_9STRA|nr:hypothetical protein TeGR_g9468 [Tetraparma gracilis]
MSAADEAERLSFTTRAPRAKVKAFSMTGTGAIPERPPTRGGTNYDQYHKQQVTIHDDDPANHIFKKTPEQMFEMKMQLKYGSPLVGECFAWGHETDWVTTMRPDGLERGLIKVGKREMERTQGRA